MPPASIFNHVIGPVMRGPSSSHTAGAFHIGCLARSLLGVPPVRAQVTCDPAGSYAACFREQGADLAFAAGLMGRELTDVRFAATLQDAVAAGLAFDLRSVPIREADHPNALDIELTGDDGVMLALRANSIGGGAVEVTRVDGWPVRLTGDAYEVFVELAPSALETVVAIVTGDRCLLEEPTVTTRGDRRLVWARRKAALPGDKMRDLRAAPGVDLVRAASPVFFVPSGQALFASAAEMVRLAQEQGLSLGQAALRYEAELLGLEERQVLAEMDRRCEVMRRAVELGLSAAAPRMQLLGPSAGRIYEAEARGDLAVGGLHTRAAARAMAVMHVNGGMGVVCAAPTAGSAGTLPAVAVTLAEEKGLDRERVLLALLAAGAVGVIVANRATFAAEVAGCQVEIGAAGAMAAAGVVEAAGGSAQQAADAAAIAFQNTMGSVCDLVQGVVEIPCHTRNAIAASSAFVCADLILGGYQNPVPLDETIDAVYAVGKMLPCELRCTAAGGLAATPSARGMARHTLRPEGS